MRARPIVLMNRAGFYPPGWVKANWPELAGRAEIVMTPLENGPELHAEIARADILFVRSPLLVGREIMAVGKCLSGNILNFLNGL